MGLFFVLVAIICAMASYSIAKSKNRNPKAWFFAGLLPIVGLFILLLLPAIGKKCPQCAEFVQPNARVCRICSYQFP